MFKKIMALIVIATLLLASCKKENVKKETVKTENQISFKGDWERSFAMGKDVNATVTYHIFEDSIQYEMNGPMKLNYTLKKDFFSSVENKWIGKKEETLYVVFFKNITKNSITVLKMKAESLEVAQKMAFPSDTARSKFSSWNTYNKK